MIVRVSRLAALSLINNGYSYTNKAALHKFLKRDVRLSKNLKTFDRALDHKNYRGKKKNLALVTLEHHKPAISKMYPENKYFKKEILRKRARYFGGNTYQQMLLTD